MLTIILAIRFSRQFSYFDGYLSLGWLHIRLALEKAPPAGQAEVIRGQVAERGYVLDATKRRSLQPANARVVPKGWTDPTIELNPKPTIKPHAPLTPPIERTFIHDFFGSQLTIGDLRIGGSLARAKHRLEITHDQLIIDNVPQSVNQGELEKIKALIRATRE